MEKVTQQLKLTHSSFSSSEPLTSIDRLKTNSLSEQKISDREIEDYFGWFFIYIEKENPLSKGKLRRLQVDGSGFCEELECDGDGNEKICLFFENNISIIS